MLYIAIIFLAVFIDQLSKYLVVTHMDPFDTCVLIADVFHLTYIKNTGAAFNLLDDKQGLLITMTLFFIILLSYFLFRLPKNKNSRLITISLACIIGGACGNLLDRFRLNYVVDFLDFRILKFAIFNFADVFVVTGSIVLIIALLLKKEFWDNNFWDSDFLSEKK